MKPVDKLRIEAITKHTLANPGILVGVTVDVERKEEWRGMLKAIDGLTIIDDQELFIREGLSVWLFRVSRMPEFHRRRLKAGHN